MSNYANVYELLAESKKTQRIVQQLYPDGWSTLHYLSSNALRYLEEMFANGKIRIKPETVTKSCWRVASLSNGELSISLGGHDNEADAREYCELLKRNEINNRTAKVIQITVEFEVDECV